MNPRRRRMARQRRKHRVEDPPYVCPGCHAIGGEPCAPGCIDAEIERERNDPDPAYLDDELELEP